jgi:hypothetical protein
VLTANLLENWAEAQIQRRIPARAPQPQAWSWTPIAIDFVAFSSNPHFAGVVSSLFVVMAVGFLDCAVGLSPKVGGMDGVEGRVHAVSVALSFPQVASAFEGV